MVQEAGESRQVPVLPFNSYYKAYVGCAVPQSNAWHKLYGRFKGGVQIEDDVEEEKTQAPQKSIIVPGPFPASMENFGANYYAEHIPKPAVDSMSSGPWKNLFANFPRAP